MISKYLSAFIFFILASSYVSGQTISGPTSVVAGQTYTYSFSNGTLFVDPWWDPATLGVALTETQNGYTYTATVRWTTVGTGTIRFKNGGGTVTSKSVTIAAPPAPNTTFTQTYKCYNTIVRRQTSPAADYDWYWQTSSSGTSTTLGKLDSVSVTTSSPLYLRTRSKYSPYPWSATSQSIGTISIKSPLVPPANSTDSNVITNGTAQTTVSVSVVSGATAYWWYTQSSGGSAINGQTATSYSPTLSQTTPYYVVSVNGACPSTTRKAVTANFHPLPVIVSTNNGLVSMGKSVTLSVSNYTYDQYEWLDGNGIAVGATTPTYSAKKAGGYKLRVTKGTSAPSTYTTPIAYNVKSGLSGVNLNYIVSNVILKQGVTSGDLDTLSVKSMSQSIQYFDGLGRPIQTVVTQGSPDKKDIVQPVVYDDFGREARKYLPVVPNSSNGWYKSGIIDTNGIYSGEAANFYSNNASSKIAQDSRPYSETTFEESPLNRPTKSYAPGAAWSTKPVELKYLINTHNTGTSSTGEKVIAWKINSSSMPVRESVITGFIETGGYYCSGQLLVNATIDEQGNAIREYKNKSGQVVLKKVQAIADSTNLNSTTDWALTYYIYDDFGNLRFVLPPELSKLIHNSADSYVVSNSDINNWAFLYKYDERKRMAEKKVPGAGKVLMVYDKRDRLVLTQDSVQRSGSTKYWSFTKYDELNRPILTGIKDTTIVLTQAQMQAIVDAHYAKAWTKFGESYVGNVASAIHGYTNKSYPITTSPAIIDKDRYLSVTYYDNYSFKNITYDSARYIFKADELTGEQRTSYFKRLLGQVTGTKIKVLDGGVAGGYTWLKSINYYDDKYRTVQIIADNYKGGTDRITNVYDFPGKVLKTKATHTEADVKWKDLIGVSYAGNILKRTSGTAGAASTQTLAAGVDGWLEFTVSEINTTRYIGLNDTNPDALGTNINYSFKLTNTTLTVVENNTTKATVTNVQPGDVLRIQRTGTAVKYYRNGVEIMLSPASTASTTLLMADVSTASANATWVGVRTSFSTTSHITTRRFEYDHAGRLLKTYHLIGTNQADEILLSKNEYNELGQLVDKKLHSTVPSASNAIQSVDYRYNIRGWLTNINESDITSGYNEPSNAGEARDFFGMDLLYEQPDVTLGNNQLYNGNISAIKWAGVGMSSAKQKAYTYSYDALNRISGSIFKEGSFSVIPTPTWTWSAPTNNAFAETGYAYDLNGNITALKRYDKRASGLMDDLVYSYAHTTEGTSNKLRKVTDNEDDYLGFVDGTNSGDDYTYDGNGNMITDQNKGITSAITYNFLNLPEVITRGTSNTVRYIYDAGGRKLAQVATFNSSQKQTDYVGEYQYENDALQHLSHEEGRIVLTSTETIFTHSADVTDNITAVNATLTAVTQNGNQKYVRANSNGTTARTGMFPIGGTFAVQAGETYRIRAKGYRTSTNAVYLNIKVNGLDINWPGATLASSVATEAWTEQTVTIPAGGATLQAGVIWNTVALNNQFFLNEFEIVKLSNNATPEYQYTLKDHLGNSRLTFTSKHEADTATATLETENAVAEQSKFIYYDEAVKINYPMYDHTNSGATTYATRLTGGSTNEKYGLAKSLSVMPGDTLNIEVYAKYLDANSSNWTAALQNFITSVANGTAPAGTLVDGGTSGSIGSQTFRYIGTLTRADDTGTGPKAYVNYLLFDRNFVYQTGGFKRISSTPRETGTDVAHERLAFDNLVITEPGYIYIYLSNENETNVEVYFDDFKVQHIKSPVIQTDDYYPFGLTYNSYQRENSVPNKIKFQGQEHVDDLGLNWDSFKWRNHQPDIGRFFNVDPIAEKYYYNSPYAFSENKVTAHVELEGLEAASIKDKEEVEEANGTNQNNNKKVDGDKRMWKAFEKVGKELPGKAGSVTDANDAYVVSAMILGKEAKNLDGTKATTADKVFSVLGAMVPVVSGSAIKKIAGQIIDVISDNATVVRGGTNTPELINKGTGTHPSGVTGVSVECGTCSVQELAAPLPHAKIGVTTVGDVRNAGGDVIRTSGASPNHATMTGLSPEKASQLLNPVITNPNKKK